MNAIPDPAIIESVTRGHPPSALAPPLISVKFLEEKNEFDPAINPETHIILKCSDDSFLAIPLAAAEKLPFPVKGPEESCGYSSHIVTALYYWCEKYGATGECAMKFPSTNTFIDFNVFCKEHPWEVEFHSFISMSIVPLINAAESLKMTGLLTYATHVLGCSIRGKSEAHILGILGVDDKLLDDEKMGVATRYSWFNDLTKTQ
eukprot:Tbor_TRINITY_DN5832_c4_g3::TRINITY_DN5832_c4_g3_i1::g.6048::m.6048